MRAWVTTCAVLVAAVALTACAAEPPLAGRVDDTTLAVQVPRLAVAVPDVAVGLGEQRVAELGAPSARSTASTAAALAGLGARAVVTTVLVEPGDAVTAGQVLAVFDPQAADAELAAAVAARSAALARVRTIGDALDDIGDKQAEVADGSREVADAIAQLESTRADLVAQRARIAELLKRLESMKPPAMPPGSTPPTGAPPVPPGPPGGLPDPGELRAGLARLDAGLARIDAGLAKARSGRARLRDARATLSDARASLRDLQQTARIAAKAADVPVSVARDRRAQLTVRAPAAGTVVTASDSGDVLAPGATLVTIRPAAGPTLVRTWVSPDAAGAVTRGSTAQVTADWMAAPATGRVHYIDFRAVFPATSYATKEIHLSRAVEVVIEMDDGALLPAGAPVDVRLR